MVPLFMKEFTMTASRAYNDDDFAATVDYFVKGKFPGFEKMVTGRIGLPDITEKGFKQLIENKDQHIKILVTPQDALLA
jgi:threonine dehydrogenase-like Zn-dependent dehydrogenase